MLGLSIPEVAGRARLPDPDAAALIARMTVVPGAARAGLIDATVRALKGAGVWAKLDLLYCLAAHDAQAARLNWVQTGFTLTPVNSPVFTADRGYAGDGATSYLDSGWVPSTEAIRYALDSASMGAWLNAGTDAATSGVASIGALGANGSFINPREAANHIRGRLNSGATVSGTGTVASRLGLTAVTRSGAANTAYYRGNALDSTAASASTALPSVALFLCGFNNSGVLGGAIDNRIAFAFAGAGLSGAEMAALHSAAQTYLAALGAA